jgi:hypothetical protein
VGAPFMGKKAIDEIGDKLLEIRAQSGIACCC